MSEKKSKKSRIRSLASKKNLVITAIAIFFFFQYFQVQSLLGTFSFLQGRDSSLLTEIGQLKEAYTGFGDDLNEVRDFLRMPTKSYVGFGDAESEEPSENANDNELQLAMFKYIGFLSSEKATEKAVEASTKNLEQLETSDTFKSFLGEEDLILTAIADISGGKAMYINLKDGRSIISYFLDDKDGTLQLKTLLDKKTLGFEDDIEEISRTLITESKATILAAFKGIADKLESIDTIIYDEKTQEETEKLGISIAPSNVENNLEYTYVISNEVGQLIGEIVLDATTLDITLIDTNEESLSVKATNISSALVPFLKKLDTKTFIEKKVDEAIANVEETMKDEGFKLLMKESGLTIETEAREYDERLFYDITDANGNLIASFVVEMSTGVVNVVNEDGTKAENLLFFDPDFKKKTLILPDQIPEYGSQVFSDDDDYNILIAGKHGSLVDTMIFAHINETKRTIRMISIPRDLFYNGRKINSYPFFYGMPELQKVLSDITGYELDKYILIDMYAFIDMIDLIGGIDIHLNQAVIDPTYKTIDDGVVGTLHYEPGDYHLGGKEALRLARTRHTSSDFARAERQQMILESLQDKAKNFGFGDADTIYEISKSVLAKTETNIDLDEAIAFYFRYQNYDIESNNVMSSGNVLYTPPYITTENCQKLVQEAAAASQPKPDCENENHAYTLLPRDNNWNLIKWFFRENFESA